MINPHSVYTQYRSLQKVDQEEPIILEAIDRIAQNDDPPPTVLLSLVQRFREPDSDESKTPSKIRGVAANLGRLALQWGAAAASSISRFILKFARNMVFTIGRFILRSVVVPVITGLMTFLTSPLGIAVGALLGAGGIGYLIYKTLFKGEDPNKVPLNGSLESEGKDSWYSWIFSDEEISDSEEETRQIGINPSTIPGRMEPAPKGNAAQNLQVMLRAMDDAGMSDPTERAMFLGQMSHESLRFKRLHEIWGPTAAQNRYEGHKGLGNTQPGDGYRYRGRGFIQLTGRSNYASAGKYLGIDLLNNPDLASDPKIAAAVALWYWYIARKGISSAAKRGDVTAVTKLINGGLNGLEDRSNQYRSYLKKINQGEYTYKSQSQTEQTVYSEPSPSVTTQPRQKIINTPPTKPAKTSIGHTEKEEDFNSLFIFEGMAVSYRA